MTKAQQGYWKSYCSEPIDKIEHYEEALAENFKGWGIHHRLEIQPDGTRVSVQELIDKGLYFGRPAEELVFMRREEHTTLHNKGNTYTKGKHLSEETRRKMSESQKGRTFSEEHCKKISQSKKGENHPFFGKHHSAEARQKMSEAVCGMLWWNNGISNKRCRECPGEGWTRGILKFK